VRLSKLSDFWLRTWN